MKKHLILGIESSCDDTSVALVRDHELIDCITISSSELQAKYGGVVPELAAREHEKAFILLVQELFKRSGVYWWEVTHIAYTENPGLIGCLLVGKVFAKTLSFIFNRPLIPINHVYGHIFSPGLTSEIKFPCLALVVSGKTTALYLAHNFMNIELLEDTSDNALGEVYDKVARELGLDYPGGEKIDALFNKDRVVPRLLKNYPNPAQRFSYSGILSAVCRLCRDLSIRNVENKEEYVATMFQRWVIDSLINKIKYWCSQKDIACLSVSGGVAANSYLQSEIKKLSINSAIVDRRFSGDNAAMIAFYASYIVQ